MQVVPGVPSHRYRYYNVTFGACSAASCLEGRDRSLSEMQRR